MSNNWILISAFDLLTFRRKCFDLHAGAKSWIFMRPKTSTRMQILSCVNVKDSELWGGCKVKLSTVTELTWDREKFWLLLLIKSRANTLPLDVRDNWVDSERRCLYLPTVCWLISPELKCDVVEGRWVSFISFFFFYAVSSLSSERGEKKRVHWQEGWKGCSSVFWLQSFKETQIMDFT